MSSPQTQCSGVTIQDVTVADLLHAPEGETAEKGLKLNMDTGIQYLESWRRGSARGPTMVSPSWKDFLTLEAYRFLE